MAPQEGRETSSVAEDRGGSLPLWRRILAYVPLSIAVMFILLPHPSFFIMTRSHYLGTLRSPVTFSVHLLAVYILTFIVFSSLAACVTRNPGLVKLTSPRKIYSGERAEDEANVSLLADEDESVNVDELKRTGLWCEQCNFRRPERAHHCSTCCRCVLKMDHHCPWLGGNCVGYRTYPSFIHFLLSATLLAAYMTCVASSVLWNLIADPHSIDPDVTPLHSLFLVLMGAIFTLTLGSFLIYHVYLVSTNQTTLEHLSPFLLLRFLPAVSGSADTTQAPSDSHPPPPKRRPPPSGSPVMTSPHSPTNSYPLYPTPPYRGTTPSPASSSTPLEEHHLSLAQRRLVMHMHGRLRPYDIGILRNWGQVFGGGETGWMRWAHIFLWGGAPRGDGHAFEHGPAVQAGLERLAQGLADIQRQEGRIH